MQGLSFFLTAMLTLGIVLTTHGGGLGGQLYAGTARAEITPTDEQAVDLVHRKIKNHDPLYARALVLRSGDTSVAIVSLDLILFSSRKVVEQAKAKYNLDSVVLSSSHTHSAPAAEGMRVRPRTRGDWTRSGSDPGEAFDWGTLSEDPWYDATERKIIAAIGEAAGNMFPAAVTAGRGPFESAYMAHNRRLVKDDKVEMLWTNPTLAPTEPLDPTVSVIRITDSDGKPRALLVHYACHPVGMMASGMVSRDFPGAMCDYIEQELGEDCMAMFIQGAEGDINPHFMGLKGQHRLNVVRQTGISLGKAALRLSESLPEPRATVDLRAETLAVPVKWRNQDRTSDAYITVMTFDNDLALVSVPGEPFVQHQLNLSTKSPVPNTLMLGVAYSGAGSPFLVYVPTEQAVREGGYGAREASFVAPDAGAQIVKAAVAKIRQMVPETR